MIGELSRGAARSRGTPTEIQRLHIRVSTTTASANSPTNRTMMVTKLGRTLRNGRGSADGTPFMEIDPQQFAVAAASLFRSTPR
jgi:hypothetical protein